MTISSLSSGSASAATRKIYRHLIEAARGQSFLPSKSTSSSTSTITIRKNAINSRTTAPLLPCFALGSNHVRSIPSYRTSPSSSEERGKESSEKSTTSPQEFHRHLCRAIQNAKQRVKIASLYIGTGTGTSSSSSSSGKIREDEFLASLQQCATMEQEVEMTVLMDGTRAVRPVPIAASSTETSTNSAKEVHNALFPPGRKREKEKKGVYLFPVHDDDDSVWMRMVPSPLDEVMGVFHIKAYIIDDELLLSGANLSEEYFTDRQDRYLSFINGANGLVDFYSDLIDVLSNYAHEYHPPSNTIKDPNHDKKPSLDIRKAELAHSLSKLFDASTRTADGHALKNDEAANMAETSSNNGGDCNSTNREKHAHEISTRTMMYAVPTFQAPSTFFTHARRQQQQRSISRIVPDADIIRNILHTLSSILPDNDMATTTRVCLSSAYLNPTSTLLSALLRYPNVDFLTSSSGSHGFAKGKGGGVAVHGGSSNGFGEMVKGLVPMVYKRLMGEAWETLKELGEGREGRRRVWLYGRDGWTFHAKGLWLMVNGGSKLASDDVVGDDGGGVTMVATLDGIVTNDVDVNDKGMIKFKRRKDGRGNENDSILLTVIGSGNFGWRSEFLDFESNCILLLNPSYSSGARLTSSTTAAYTGGTDSVIRGGDGNGMSTTMKKEGQQPRCDDDSNNNNNDPWDIMTRDWNGMMMHTTEMGNKKDAKVVGSDNGVEVGLIASSLSAAMAMIGRKYF